MPLQSQVEAAAIEIRQRPDKIRAEQVLDSWWSSLRSNVEGALAPLASQITQSGHHEISPRRLGDFLREKSKEAGSRHKVSLNDSNKTWYIVVSPPSALKSRQVCVDKRTLDKNRASRSDLKTVQRENALLKEGLEAVQMENAVLKEKIASKTSDLCALGTELKTSRRRESCLHERLEKSTFEVQDISRLLADTTRRSNELEARLSELGIELGAAQKNESIANDRLRALGVNPSLRRDGVISILYSSLFRWFCDDIP